MAEEDKKKAVTPLRPAEEKRVVSPYEEALQKPDGAMQPQQVQQAPAATPQTQQADQSYENVAKGYDTSINTLETARSRIKPPETDKERQAREKSERSSRIISAVGDGIRAMSNLFFTNKYAPNMYNHEKDSQYKATTAFQDKLKAERDAEYDKYLDYSLKIGNLQTEKGKTLEALKAQAKELQLKENAAKQAAELHPYKVGKAISDANTAANRAITAQAEANNASGYYEAKTETERQRGKTEQTRQDANRASAENSRSSAAAHERSNVQEFAAYDESGREYKFKTKQAADNFAKQHGTFQEEQTKTDTSTTNVDRRGKQTTRNVSQTKGGGGYAKKPGSSDKTPPSRQRQATGNTPPSRQKKQEQDNRPPSRRR